MSKILNTLSAVGALVLAATPLAAVAGFAHAADYQPVRIQVSDLDFNTASGAASFRHRVNVAADTMCAAGADLGARAACRSAVQGEAVERLGPSQRQELRTAETARRSAWRVASE